MKKQKDRYFPYQRILALHQMLTLLLPLVFLFHFPLPAPFDKLSLVELYIAFLFITLVTFTFKSTITLLKTAPFILIALFITLSLFSNILNHNSLSQCAAIFIKYFIYLLALPLILAQALSTSKQIGIFYGVAAISFLLGSLHGYLYLHGIFLPAINIFSGASQAIFAMILFSFFLLSPSISFLYWLSWVLLFLMMFINSHPLLYVASAYLGLIGLVIDNKKPFWFLGVVMLTLSAFGIFSGILFWDISKIEYWKIIANSFYINFMQFAYAFSLLPIWGLGSHQVPAFFSQHYNVPPCQLIFVQSINTTFNHILIESGVLGFLVFLSALIIFSKPVKSIKIPQIPISLLGLILISALLSNLLNHIHLFYLGSMLGMLGIVSHTISAPYRHE